jgi:hypothetical protein
MGGSNTKWRIGSFTSLCLNNWIKIAEGDKKGRGGWAQQHLLEDQILVYA